MDSVVCSACRERPGMLRVHRNHGPAALYCHSCAQSELGSTTRTSNSPDPLKFFLALTQLTSSAPTPNAQHPIPNTHGCPSCGLTYAEFETIGLAGCEGCYGVFADVIEEALREMAILQ